MTVSCKRSKGAEHAGQDGIHPILQPEPFVRSQAEDVERATAPPPTGSVVTSAVEGATSFPDRSTNVAASREAWWWCAPEPSIDGKQRPLLNVPVAETLELEKEGVGPPRRWPTPRSGT